jgi:hypothetical protein
MTQALTPAADASCGPAAVDLVHRSTVDRSRGYTPFLIWAVRTDRTALVARGQRAAAVGLRQEAAAELAGDGQIGHPST